MLKESHHLFKHHYVRNRHHPEYHCNGISDMTIIDKIEMVCDWMAAIKRYKDGSIERSMRVNKEKFELDDCQMRLIAEIFEELK
jgi:hypothetical protein